jgi:hypothetical protein
LVVTIASISRGPAAKIENLADDSIREKTVMKRRQILILLAVLLAGHGSTIRNANLGPRIQAADFTVRTMPLRAV